MGHVLERTSRRTSSILCLTITEKKILPSASKKMRVAFVLDKWGYLGGMEQHNISMLRSLTEEGHKCSLVYGYDTGYTVRDSYFENINKFLVPALYFSNSLDSSSIENLIDILKKEYPDVIYLGDVKNATAINKIIEFWPTIAVVQSLNIICLRECKAFYFRRKPCPYKLGIGCILRGCFLGKGRNKKSLLRFNNLKRLLALQNSFKKVHAIIVPSEFVSYELQKNGFDRSKIKNFGYFNENIPETIMAIPKEGDVLFVGRIDRYKGLDILIKALARSNTAPNLTVIGKGPHLDFCKNLSKKLGMERQINFSGWISHNELFDYYRKAAVVAIPSLSPETFCKVGIEALANGRPVIGFNVGGINEWLIHEKTGFLVDWKDIDGFAYSIDRIFSDLQLAENMGITGRDLVIRKFTKEQYMKNWENLLNTII